MGPPRPDFAHHRHLRVGAAGPLTPVLQGFLRPGEGLKAVPKGPHVVVEITTFDRIIPGQRQGLKQGTKVAGEGMAESRSRAPRAGDMGHLVVDSIVPRALARSCTQSNYVPGDAILDRNPRSHVPTREGPACRAKLIR
jgi:hypothetical protein